MDLSSPKLRKILIGLAIFTVVVFITIKIWRRSYYSYPNTSEDAQVPITAMTSGTPAGSTTVTATGHNFKVGDIVLLKVTGLTFAGTSGVMPTVSGATGTPVIVATVTIGVSFTFVGTFTGTFTATGATAESIGYGVMTELKSALVTCQDTYATAIIAAGTNQAAKDTANTTRTFCIATAVAPYTRGHCQWLPAAGSTTIPEPQATNPLAFAAWSTYQNDIKLIQTAYVQASNRAAAGSFAGIATTATASDIVSKARAADITGATQKYLATVCPGFYQPGDSTQPDPSPVYKTWTARQEATDSVATTVTHFYAPTTGITDAAIMNWAQYARTVTFTATTATVSGGLTATVGLLAPVASGGYGPIGTYTDKSGGGTTGAENWRTAYIKGPGTVSTIMFQVI